MLLLCSFASFGEGFGNRAQVDSTHEASAQVQTSPAAHVTPFVMHLREMFAFTSMVLSFAVMLTAGFF
jgi:hypothetical protein